MSTIYTYVHHINVFLVKGSKKFHYSRNNAIYYVLNTYYSPNVHTIMSIYKVMFVQLTL